MVAPGTRLGPYEILAKVGEGGMGEVYRARDTRLDRLVAVKVLPAEFSADAERRGRFEREARAIAALTHPHICTLHDVGREQDLDYLVMELIDGQTLADRLRGGRLDLAEALACAVQIADAIAAAHRLGIVHRDLKPGNVMMVRPSSGSPPRPHVKLLDFGLARRGVETVTSDVATVAAPLTGAGTLVGTLNYMAPEQLHGAPYDARVDVFAFGAVLFEMLTGRRAFDGSSHASVVAAVLHTDPPPVTAVVPDVPTVLGRVVTTCLAKDPDHRWSTMHDVLLQLQAMTAVDGPAVPGGAPPRRRLQWPSWSVAALSAVVAAAAWIGPRAPAGDTASAPPRPDVLSVLPPPGATPSYAWEAPQLSPDGRHVAFAASDQSGTVWLYVRSLETIEPRRLPGTEDASHPFWAPDSTRLGFFAAGQLKVVGVDGGTARTLAAAPVPRGGTWGLNDVILYSAVPNTPPMTVPAAGGEPALVPVERVERGFRSFPQLLPDGRHYLFEALEGVAGGPIGIHVASLDSTEVREVVKTRGHGVFVDGRLLFLRESTLVAQAFDTETLRLHGTPVVIAEDVGFTAITYQGLFSVSR
ncbi:MAG: protein kinase, partial [Vicinamibacterales bacterium]